MRIKTTLAKWTALTVECYIQRCQCSTCPYVAEDLKRYCRAKDYVLAAYRKYGKPTSANILYKVRWFLHEKYNDYELSERAN